MAPFIIGVTLAMEEQGKNETQESTNGVKIGLMGPLEGLGDSLMWLTLISICMSIGASYGQNGNPIGILIALALFNIIISHLNISG